jgi:hypothetical protein
VDDYASGLLNREQLARAKDRVDFQIEKCQGELNKLQPASVLPRQPLRDVWDTLAIDMKLAIIRLVVDRVRVFPGQSGATWRQWRFDTSKVEIDWKVMPPPAQ